MRDVRLREGPVVIIELTVFTHDRCLPFEWLRETFVGRGNDCGKEFRSKSTARLRYKSDEARLLSTGRLGKNKPSTKTRC